VRGVCGKFGEVDLPVERDEGDMDPDREVVPPVHELDPFRIPGEGAGQVGEVVRLPHDEEDDRKAENENKSDPREVGVREEEGGGDDEAGQKNPFLPSFRGYLPLLAG